MITLQLPSGIATAAPAFIAGTDIVAGKAPALPTNPMARLATLLYLESAIEILVAEGRNNRDAKASLLQKQEQLSRAIKGNQGRAALFPTDYQLADHAFESFTPTKKPTADDKIQKWKDNWVKQKLKDDLKKLETQYKLLEKRRKAAQKAFNQQELDNLKQDKALVFNLISSIRLYWENFYLTGDREVLRLMPLSARFSKLQGIVPFEREDEAQGFLFSRPSVAQGGDKEFIEVLLAFDGQLTAKGTPLLLTHLASTSAPVDFTRGTKVGNIEFTQDQLTSQLADRLHLVTRNLLSTRHNVIFDQLPTIPVAPSFITVKGMRVWEKMVVEPQRINYSFSSGKPWFSSKGSNSFYLANFFETEYRQDQVTASKYKKDVIKGFYDSYVNALQTMEAAYTACGNTIHGLGAANDNVRAAAIATCYQAYHTERANAETAIRQLTEAIHQAKAERDKGWFGWGKRWGNSGLFSFYDALLAKVNEHSRDVIEKPLLALSFDMARLRDIAIEQQYAAHDNLEEVRVAAPAPAADTVATTANTPLPEDTMRALSWAVSKRAATPNLQATERNVLGVIASNLKHQRDVRKLVWFLASNDVDGAMADAQIEAADIVGDDFNDFPGVAELVNSSSGNNPAAKAACLEYAMKRGFPIVDLAAGADSCFITFANLIARDQNLPNQRIVVGQGDARQEVQFPGGRIEALSKENITLVTKLLTFVTNYGPIVTTLTRGDSTAAGVRQSGAAQPQPSSTPQASPVSTDTDLVSWYKGIFAPNDDISQLNETQRAIALNSTALVIGMIVNLSNEFINLQASFGTTSQENVDVREQLTLRLQHNQRLVIALLRYVLQIDNQIRFSDIRNENLRKFISGGLLVAYQSIAMDQLNLIVAGHYAQGLSIEQQALDANTRRAEKLLKIDGSASPNSAFTVSLEGITNLQRRNSAAMSLLVRLRNQYQAGEKSTPSQLLVFLHYIFIPATDNSEVMALNRMLRETAPQEAAKAIWERFFKPIFDKTPGHSTGAGDLTAIEAQAFKDMRQLFAVYLVNMFPQHAQAVEQLITTNLSARAATRYGEDQRAIQYVKQLMLDRDFYKKPGVGQKSVAEKWYDETVSAPLQRLELIIAELVTILSDKEQYTGLAQLVKQANLAEKISYLVTNQQHIGHLTGWSDKLRVLLTSSDIDHGLLATALTDKVYKSLYPIFVESARASATDPKTSINRVFEFVAAKNIEDARRAANSIGVLVLQSNRDSIHQSYSIEARARLTTWMQEVIRTLNKEMGALSQVIRLAQTQQSTPADKLRAIHNFLMGKGVTVEELQNLGDLNAEFANKAGQLVLLKHQTQYEPIKTLVELFGTPIHKAFISSPLRFIAYPLQAPEWMPASPLPSGEDAKSVDISKSVVFHFTTIDEHDVHDRGMVTATTNGFSGLYIEMLNTEVSTKGAEPYKGAVAKSPFVNKKFAHKANVLLELIIAQPNQYKNFAAFKAAVDTLTDVKNPIKITYKKALVGKTDTREKVTIKHDNVEFSPSYARYITLFGADLQKGYLHDPASHFLDFAEVSDSNELLALLQSSALIDMPNEAIDRFIKRIAQELSTTAPEASSTSLLVQYQTASESRLKAIILGAKKAAIVEAEKGEKPVAQVMRDILPYSQHQLLKLLATGEMRKFIEDPVVFIVNTVAEFYVNNPSFQVTSLLKLKGCDAEVKAIFERILSINTASKFAEYLKVADELQEPLRSKYVTEMLPLVQNKEEAQAAVTSIIQKYIDGALDKVATSKTVGNWVEALHAVIPEYQQRIIQLFGSEFQTQFIADPKAINLEVAVKRIPKVATDAARQFQEASSTGQQEVILFALVQRVGANAEFDLALATDSRVSGENRTTLVAAIQKKADDSSFGSAYKMSLKQALLNRFIQKARDIAVGLSTNDMDVAAAIKSYLVSPIDELHTKAGVTESDLHNVIGQQLGEEIIRLGSGASTLKPVMLRLRTTSKTEILAALMPTVRQVFNLDETAGLASASPTGSPSASPSLAGRMRSTTMLYDKSKAGKGVYTAANHTELTGIVDAFSERVTTWLLQTADFNNPEHYNAERGWIIPTNLALVEHDRMVVEMFGDAQQKALLGGDISSIISGLHVLQGAQPITTGTTRTALDFGKVLQTFYKPSSQKDGMSTKFLDYIASHTTAKFFGSSDYKAETIAKFDAAVNKLLTVYGAEQVLDIAALPITTLQRTLVTESNPVADLFTANNPDTVYAQVRLKYMLHAAVAIQRFVTTYSSPASGEEMDARIQKSGNILAKDLLALTDSIAQLEKTSPSVFEKAFNSSAGGLTGFGQTLGCSFLGQAPEGSFLNAAMLATVGSKGNIARVINARYVLQIEQHVARLQSQAGSFLS